MIRIQHDLVQGTPEWKEFRLRYHGASEAAAMMGVSKNVTRSELLHMKHTGMPQEFSNFVQEKILDKGIEVEKLARPMAENVIGSELFPATFSRGTLSCSCDGITMDETVTWEHKQWNQATADYIRKENEPPIEHFHQCQQNLYVTGADKLLFMVSDGTPENCVHCWVFPDEAIFERIWAGWNQFDEDLKNYKPPEVIPAAVAAPMLDLPAVSIRVDGAVKLISNLTVFGDKLKEFVERIPKQPSTDDEFATCKAACKKLGEAEDALDAAEGQAMGQVASFDEMRRMKAMLVKLARDTRLATEKLVTAREKAIKEEIVVAGRNAFAEHLLALNNRLGKAYMPQIKTDFLGAIKNKRTVASLKDAVDTELARLKIEANEIADRIQINMRVIRTAAGEMDFLFKDEADLVLKDIEHVKAVVTLRVNEYEESEKVRKEKEREKIRQEELARIEREREAVERKRVADAEEANAKISAADPNKPISTGIDIPPYVVSDTPTSGSGLNPALASDAGRQHSVGVSAPPKPKVGINLRPTDLTIVTLLANTYRVPIHKILEWLRAMDFDALDEQFSREMPMR